ncbi:hypothetical protein D8B26_001643 [Coccidioides posadasii str. Silveira]|uniref:Sucrase/ferredoxin domain-containing protein n=1 Tax=Coccidioides posadasii (strain RMSCC 757 / Silveira) TaxID=443226 RepID=E9CVW8_COCPS|nr:sucrase/ferredoxin domain-containing protein [Coccidioides posadasii str. Silveira]QVM06937.1 hypothetical protein D8B26_001643 [Coccidioides posadasii str. Silveira]
MASIFRRGLEYLSPSASPAPSSVSDYEATSVPATGKPAVASKVITAQSPSTLFTVVDPTVDGEDCDHDCASCTIKYPAKFSVDYEDELYGHVKGWATHVLVATGKTDWVRDVADEKGSVMEAIERGGVSAKNGALKLSASNIPVPDEYYHHPEGEQPTTVLLLPAFTIIDHVTPALVPNLIRQFVDLSPTTTTPLSDVMQIAGQEEPTEQTPSDTNIPERPPLDLKDLSESLPTSLRSRPCSHTAVILLCSQKTRDARCGQSAPLLRREFERHLRPLGLYRDLHDERPGGVGIYFISHVGGHKYSANVIVYRRRNFEWFKEGKDDCSNNVESMEKEGASQCIWLARVRPEDCEGIVKFTVLQGKVVKPGLQLRGGFDREKGLISW